MIAATASLRGLYASIVIASAIGLGLFAARHPTRLPIAIATPVGAIAATTVLYAGQLVFPLLYFIASRRKGRFVGWALLIAMLVSPPILHWRMPWPRPAPVGPTLSTTASVVTLRTVDHVGGGHRTHGQSLRIPMQIATLSFTPRGANAPVTVTDTIDSGTVASLQERGTISVIYSPPDPESARVAGATRNYAADLWRYIMEIVYGTTLATAVVIAFLDLVRRLVRIGGPTRRANGVHSQLGEGFSRPLGR